MENEQRKQIGVTVAILEEFRTQRLPRALLIKEKVLKGEQIDRLDLEFLDEVIHHIEQFKPRIDLHPEYQVLFSEIVDLYHSITQKALENEESALSS
jgi:hypothetical protein